MGQGWKLGCTVQWTSRCLRIGPIVRRTAAYYVNTGPTSSTGLHTLRIVHADDFIIRSCQLAATSEIVQRFWSRV